MSETSMSDALIITGVTGKTSSNGYTTYSGTRKEALDDLTLTAVGYGDAIYVKMVGKYYNMNNCTITYGTEIVAPEETSTTVNYDAAAKVVYKGKTLDVTSQKVDITEEEGGTYTIVLKDLAIGVENEGVVTNYTLGTLTIAGVTGSDEGEGILFYETAADSKAVLSGVSAEATTAFGLVEGAEIPVAMDGGSQGDRLEAKFTLDLNGNKCVVLYNGYQDDYEYTAPAVVTYWGQNYNYEEQVVDVTKTDEAAGLYTITLKDLTISNTVIADITAENVKGTENSDGTITYEFNGEGYLSNIGTAYSSSFAEGEKIPLTIAAIEEGNNFRALFTTTLTSNDLTLNFNYYVAPVTPTTYTADATSYWTDNQGGEVTGTHTGKKAYVYANEDGTYKFVIPEAAFMQQATSTTESTVADFTIDNVAVTEGADGSLSFDYSGNATTANASSSAVNEEQAVTFKGSINGDDLYFVLSCQILGYCDYTYTFGTEPAVEPEIEGTVVVADDYASAGYPFSETASIDWETQKLVASIDVTGCTGSYENILSVGKNISDWNGECFHLYYSRSSKTLQVNYCTSSGNPIRMEKTVDADVLNVEITKANGIYVNGENWNYANDDNYTGDLTDDMTIYSVLWGLSEIQVGSQEGDNRSNATYKYVRVQDLPVTITDTETYNEDMTVTEPSTKTATITSAKLDINTYSDGTYGVTIYGVEGQENDLGDITVKGLTVSEEDGNTYYNGDSEVTVNGETMFVAVAGVKYANGKVWFTVELVTYDEDVYSIEFGKEDTSAGINTISADVLNGKADIYTVNGAKVNALQRGINLVRVNGKTVKVVKK